MFRQVNLFDVFNAVVYALRTAPNDVNYLTILRNCKPFAPTLQCGTTFGYFGIFLVLLLI